MYVSKYSQLNPYRFNSHTNNNYKSQKQKQNKKLKAAQVTMNRKIAKPAVVHSNTENIIEQLKERKKEKEPQATT